MGAVVQLRKPHPCGGDTWKVVRLGADIGLECATCRRRVLLERRVLERRLKRFVQVDHLQQLDAPPPSLPPRPRRPL
ncbi:MAG: DUF951 domain-containing protein [Chloroflexi bacterium]|nr:DUF951 domain-containing protein [Chloroflexota bacterium]